MPNSSVKKKRKTRDEDPITPKPPTAEVAEPSTLKRRRSNHIVHTTSESEPDSDNSSAVGLLERVRREEEAEEKARKANKPDKDKV